MTAYYNEFDPAAAACLRELIKAGLIADGEVDERSILDVRPDDLRGFTQCHFFAGIGGWSLGLRLAGWEDSRPAWTGSAPCQPFSVANVAHGGAKGTDDERHLAPKFAELVAVEKPAVVFGEQVARAVNWGWLDELFWALEAEDYACAAAVLPALAVGARHQRDRLYWVAHACGEGWERYQPIERVSIAAEEALSLHGDPLARAGRALDGDHADLLPSDGVSVGLERLCAKGFGNAIVPQQAAAFIQSVMDCIPERTLPEPLQRLAQARQRLAGGGAAELRKMISEGSMGRGGNAGAHVVVGFNSAGNGVTEAAAIEDWVRDAGEQLERCGQMEMSL